MKPIYRLIALILLASAFWGSAITRPPAHAQDTTPIDYDELVWSPDGTHLAYSSRDDIWVYDFATGEHHNLTGDVEGLDSSPVWSPDSTQIAFASTRAITQPIGGFATTDVWEIDADGSNPVNLTNTSDLSYAPASFSPDGRYLTVTVSLLDLEAERFEIWVSVMSLENLTISRISSEGDFAASPRFSPDGHSILFLSSDIDNSTMWGADFENGQVSSAKAILTDDDFIGTYDWSPDSCCFVFSLIVGEELPVARLKVMNVETGAVTTLTDGFEGNQAIPAWSPDGTQIAFVNSATARPLDNQLWVMDADGSNPIFIGAAIAGKVRLPVWSPDGSQIAVIVENGVIDDSLLGYTFLGSDIWLINADGSNPQNLTGNFQ